MKAIRPAHVPCTLSEWFAINSAPGALAKYLERLNFTPEERKKEHHMWQVFMQTAPVPSFYDGFVDLMKRVQALGSKVVVVSHSDVTQITRHYQTTGMIPDAIFGQAADVTKMKPYAWPVTETLSKYPECSINDCCVIDDMAPGIVMAKETGTYPICAAWGPTYSCCAEVRHFMAQHAKAVCTSISDLAKILLA
jgi:beta-phosphoglucomutase-like phosphatase (HAD superfamily)